MIQGLAVGATLFLTPLTLHQAATRAAHYEQHHGVQARVLDCRWVDHRRWDAGCLVEANGVSWMVSVMPHGVINGPAPRKFQPVVPVAG